MLRSFSVKWLGIFALVLSPAVAYGQATMPRPTRFATAIRCGNWPSSIVGIPSCGPISIG